MSSFFGLIVKKGKAKLKDIIAMSGCGERDRPSPDPEIHPSAPLPDGPRVEGSVGWGGGWRYGNVILQWDGDIHNRSTLLRYLKSPTEDSDTVLLLRGLQTEGFDFLNRINGPLALAYWDLRERVLVLARSGHGLCSIFWFESPYGVAFARDPATLTRCPWVSTEPNWKRIPEYMVFDNVTGGETLYRDIRELLPGESLRIDMRAGLSELKKTPLMPSRPPISLPRLDLYKHTRKRLQASTARLWKTAPAQRSALFLSGGVDSALLADALTRVAQGPGLPCITVTSPGFRYDESTFARVVRDRLGLPGVEIPLDPATFAQGWQEALRVFRYPMTSTNQVPWWIMCRAAGANGLRTVFSGEGADGWICGGLYPDERTEVNRFWATDLKRVETRIVLCRSHCLNDAAVVEKIMSVPLDTANRQKIWTRIRSEGQGHSPDDLEVLYHLQTTGNRLLTRADQVALHHGIRLRLPYLERGWLRWIGDMPFHVRNPDGMKKRILKDLCARLWDEAFAHRKKIGFTFPLRIWTRDAKDPFLVECRAMLLDRKTLNRGIFHRPHLEREVRLRLEGRIKPADWLLWSLINLEVWLRDLNL